MQNNKRWKRIVNFGNGIAEVEEYMSTRRGLNKSNFRGKNKRSTDIDQLILNERYAEDHLRWLINCNFKHNDWHLALTYKKEERPEYEIAIKRVQKFLRDMRAIYKKHGQEFKYIWSTELGKRGAIHHHFIINYSKPVDLQAIQALWRWGKVRVNGTLDSSGEYGALANYIIKNNRKAFDCNQFPNHKRYNASKNLQKPDIKYKKVKGREWRNQPKNTKKFLIIGGTLHEGVHGIFGTPWRRYQIRYLE